MPWEIKEENNFVHFVYLQNIGFISTEYTQHECLFTSRARHVCSHVQNLCQVSTSRLGHSRGSQWVGCPWTSWSDLVHGRAREHVHPPLRDLPRVRNPRGQAAPVRAVICILWHQFTLLWTSGMLFLNIFTSQGGHWETFLSCTPCDEDKLTAAV